MCLAQHCRPPLQFENDLCHSIGTHILWLWHHSFQEIREGEPVELLVVASQPGFGDFKALKEAYLPESALWLADYPYVDRDAFLELSLAVERERAAQPAAYGQSSSSAGAAAPSRAAAP